MFCLGSVLYQLEVLGDWSWFPAWVPEEMLACALTSKTPMQQHNTKSFDYWYHVAIHRAYCSDVLQLLKKVLT